MNDPHAITPPPLPATVRRQPQFSEVAARAAQHVHDLEMMIESLQADVHALTARLTVADERARVIQAENEFLMKDRDYHKEKCVRIETKLNSAAQLILDAMSSPTREPHQQQTEVPALTMQELELPKVTESAHIPTEPEVAKSRNGNGKRRSGGETIDGS